MIYLDTSALLKLVVEENESDILEGWLDGRRSTPWVTSALARVELVRACRRLDVDLLPSVDVLLAGLDLIPLQDEVLQAAADLPDPGLRSLDALHLASAMALESALDVLVAYDLRLLAAAQSAGIETARPGA